MRIRLLFYPLFQDSFRCTGIVRMIHSLCPESDTARRSKTQVHCMEEGCLDGFHVAHFYGAEQLIKHGLRTWRCHHSLCHTLDQTLFYQIMHPASVAEVFIPLPGFRFDEAVQPFVGFGSQNKIPVFRIRCAISLSSSEV